MSIFSSGCNEGKGGNLGQLPFRLGKRDILYIIVICILAASAILPYVRFPPVVQRGTVGIIRIEGYVETPSVVSLYTDLVNQAVLNDSIRAVVLVIDSGGGYADYVEQVYLDLMVLKEKKPVVASIVTALSGGYYIAAAADYIYALPTSFVGSIGVIGTGPSILIPSETTLETGPYKATGFSALLFPYNMSHALDNFVSAVNKSRTGRLKLSSTQLEKGMIYLGSEAVDVGLVDEAGSLQAAIGKAASLAKLSTYNVIELTPQSSSSYASLQGYSNYTSISSGNLTLKILDDLHPPPAIHYIYLPPQVTSQSSSSPISSAALTSTGGDVIVDLSHGNQISWWDLDILIAELASRNLTVSFVTQPDELDAKIVGASCLIVASPTQAYTDEECSSIEEFVDRGGLLLMFHDPAWEYIGQEGLTQGIIAPVNSLATRFGISYAKGYLYNEAENYGIYRNIYVRNFANNSLTRNLNSLALFTATSIHSAGKGVAWTSNDTFSSVAEKTGSYTPLVLVERGNGTVVAIGDLTFLTEPYCYVEDNYQLILNLVSLVTEVETQVEEGNHVVEGEVGRPNIPVGTEKNYTEWVDGEEILVRWFKVSETEVTVERPDRTTHYYTAYGSLERWVSDGMECTYEDPLPEPPYPLTKSKSWEYQSRYTLTIDGTLYTGKFSGEEEVEGLEDVVAGDGESYFCAVVTYKYVEQLLVEGSNMTMVTTGRYWISSDAGTVKEEAVTDYYVDDAFAGRERRTLLLKSIRKEQGS